ncbi:hypothetical protein D3C79_588580 [compost metagenome]
MRIHPLQILADMTKQPRFRIAEHFRDHRVTRGFGGDLQHQHMVSFVFTRLLELGAGCQSAGNQVNVIAQILQTAHFTGDDAIDDFFDDRVFIGKVAVDLTDAELRTLGDFRHAGGVKTMLTKTKFRRIDNLIAAGLRFGLPAVAGGYHVPILYQEMGSLFGCERSFSIVMQERQKGNSKGGASGNEASGEQINLDKSGDNQQAQQGGGHFSGGFGQAKHQRSHPVWGTG